MLVVHRRKVSQRTICGDSGLQERLELRISLLRAMRGMMGRDGLWVIEGRSVVEVLEGICLVETSHSPEMTVSALCSEVLYYSKCREVFGQD